MPYANKEDYLKWLEANKTERYEYLKQWRDSHKEKVAEYKKKSHAKITIKKRCPKCKKQVTLRKDYKTVTCKHCGKKIRVSKTLSENPNHDNAHGIRLKVFA